MKNYLFKKTYSKNPLVFLLTTILIGGLFVATSYATGDSEGEGEDTVFTYASNAGFTHFDPHNYNTSSQGNIYAQVYEALTARDENFQIVPGLGLAESWELVSSTSWEFTLQQGVQFHNGADFTAEDVYVSWQRAKNSTEGSISVAKNIIVDIKVIDDYTITIETASYAPVLPAALTSLFIVDSGWIEENNLQEVLTSADTDIKYTVEHANGTGVYTLSSLAPGEEIVFDINENYWNPSRAGTISQFRYLTIEKDSTRIAAISSGQVDLIFPVPIQDWQRIESNEDLSLETGTEGRPIFLGLDQYRDTLIGAEPGASSNPFKDKRVRQAFNLAVDIDQINDKIMQGKALPIGILSAPGLGGHPNNVELNKPYAYNVEEAKRLLKEAGYPNGFSVTFDAPNNRYINDEAVAQAIVAMLAKVNINAKLRTQPRSAYFDLIFNKRETSVYMLGWGPIAAHDFDIVTRLLTYPTESPKLGGYNIGKYNNPEIVEISKKLGDASYQTQFDALIEEAYRIAKDDYAYVPLFAPPLSVAVKKDYSFIVFPDERIEFRYITKQ